MALYALLLCGIFGIEIIVIGDIFLNVIDNVEENIITISTIRFLPIYQEEEFFPVDFLQLAFSLGLGPIEDQPLATNIDTTLVT